MSEAQAPAHMPGHQHAWRMLDPFPGPHGAATHAPVVVVGAGPVGLALAIDLGMRGHPVIVLGKNSFVPAGSKAICFSKRSLDILDRLGVGESAVAKGVVWNVGKVFRGASRDPVYQFDMLPVKNQKMPGFINIQQYYLEDMLIERASQLPNVELRWGHEVTELEAGDDGTVLTVAAGQEVYTIRADWTIACDGSKSTVRSLMGLDFQGRIFEENFLIADIRMQQQRPSERWFWFDPPFHPGQSVLLHKQPDDVWRIDFQLGWDVDRAQCVKPEYVDRLVSAMLGPGVEYEPVWYSVYTFQCRRMARFLHGRVIFAGDSAHLVSPFGARGCNGGFADIDNLAWKLDMVLRDAANEDLLETYNAEAVATADENIMNSTRSTDFLTPKSQISTAFRDAVLDLAATAPFARALVNSGRLSTPVSYPTSALNTPDEDHWARGIAPGSPAVDAPLGDGWLLERLGNAFKLICHDRTGALDTSIDVIDAADHSNSSALIERYGLVPGSAYLIRPDQYVAARFRAPTTAKLAAAIARASGGTPHAA